MELLIKDVASPDDVIGVFINKNQVRQSEQIIVNDQPFAIIKLKHQLKIMHVEEIVQDLKLAGWDVEIALEI